MVAVEMRSDREEPFGDGRTDAGVDEGDAPVGDVAIQKLHVAAAIREDEVVGERLAVVEEVLLDALGLVAQAKDEVVVPP